MNKKEVLDALKKLKKDSKERKFKQSVDLIINFRDLDLKKPDHQVEFFANLHHDRGKKIKICAFSAQELADEAKKHCDTVIMQGDFEAYKKEPKKAKKLANDHDFFIAQANIMPQVAATFGRVLGIRGKMPNPKAGMIVPPKTTLAPVVKRLQNTMKISAKKVPIVQVRIGNEEQTDDILADNVMTIYDQIIHHLPRERHNIKNAYLKLTMGKPEKLM
ncbi:MAG: 50S ribosomal protein L1 [archaeon]